MIPSSLEVEMDPPAILFEKSWKKSAGRFDFDPINILRSSIGEYEQFCTGYNGVGGYCLALVMGIGIAEEIYSYSGSNMLDSIVAYDDAEVEDAYIGQINMIMVSSFCGPQGAIWGYDIARSHIELPDILDEAHVEEFEGIRIVNGDTLRQASRMLFGTKQKRHFPFIPGSHVPCAGKYHAYKGETTLYSAVAIGIPDDRTRQACLIMEDVGELQERRIRDDATEARKRIAVNMMRSVVQVGKNHGTNYKEIILEVILKEVPVGHIGCALVAAPYFNIARESYEENLDELSLQEWYGLKRNQFLDRYDDYEIDLLYDPCADLNQAVGSLK